MKSLVRLEAPQNWWSWILPAVRVCGSLTGRTEIKTASFDLNTRELTPTAVTKPTRITSVDFLRGSVMIIMALDHSRDFLTNFPYEPTDLAHTTPILFFTRWITHFCAPVFMFLAGTAAFLSLSRGRSRPEATWFLVSRGLFLVIADQTIMRIGWFTKPSLLPILGSTLWGLGWAMVALSAMIWLPRWILIAVSAALVLFHDAFDGFTGGSWGTWQWLWVELHTGSFSVHGQRVLFVGYSLIPWVGVMGLGYAFGQIMLFEAARPRKYLFMVGILLTVGFVALRVTNWYGDPVRWAHHEIAAYTLMSFLNCEKYPPSLLFLLMTLGPAITLLLLLEGVRGRVANVVLVLGSVPLFYYVVHIFVLHTIALQTRNRRRENYSGLAGRLNSSFLLAFRNLTRRSSVVSVTLKSQ